MAFALTTGRAERSSTVNIRRMFSSHTDGLVEKEMTALKVSLMEFNLYQYIHKRIGQ